MTSDDIPRLMDNSPRLTHSYWVSNAARSSLQFIQYPHFILVYPHYTTIFVGEIPIFVS